MSPYTAVDLLRVLRQDAVDHDNPHAERGMDEVAARRKRRRMYRWITSVDAMLMVAILASVAALAATLAS